MKLLTGNGKLLEVRDVGPVIFRLVARRGGAPIKFNDSRVIDDGAAREILRELVDTGAYDGGRVI